MKNFSVLRVITVLACLAFVTVIGAGALVYASLGSCGPSAPSTPEVPGTVKMGSLPWDHPVVATIRAYELRGEPKTALTITIRNVKKDEVVSIDIERFERSWGCGGDSHKGTSRHSITAKGLPSETIEIDLDAPDDDQYFSINGRVGFTSNALLLTWDAD